MAMRFKAGTALGAGILALALVGPVSPASAAGGGCADASTNIENLSRGDAIKSLTCLINSERSSALSKNGDLSTAAQNHTDTMREKDCFKHKCKGELGLKKRVQATGYLNGADDPKIGEVIAYGNDKSPSDIVDKWLESSVHRDLIKDPSFVDIGVGVNTQGGDILVTGVLGHK